MEDIINALLDVVRAQHSATEGTDEAPFNMDDIVDMALNLMGRPDEQEEMDEMVGSIQKMVESLAPDIFPPKTFEEMDNSEKALSAASMIENAFLRNNGTATAPVTVPDTMVPDTEEEEDEGVSQNPGDLNDLIYKNFMEMMGLSTPQVEYPFDRSQIQYGREKSFTEQLAEEEEEKARREEAERSRKLSAWELAQNAIDSDEAAHSKEPYVPKPVEQPETKSASQMAAEAIRKSQEEDRMKLEIEKQAEAMMAEARKRGQDPMKFMLHQQEILQYMESNSDELVSFEDYEDLSPEEKLEIETKLHIQKQLDEGVSPDQIDPNVPEEYIPIELRQNAPHVAQAATEDNGEASQASQGDAGSVEVSSTFDEDTLRMLSQQVLSENAEMFQDDESVDMAAFQEELFENLRRAMAGSGTPVPLDDIGSLLEQAAANSKAEEGRESAAPQTAEPSPEPARSVAEQPSQPASAPMSAVELAMAAQQAARPAKPVEERKTVSAADLAKAAQEQAKKNPTPGQEPLPEEESPEELDMSFDELDDIFDEDENDEVSQPTNEDITPVEESVSQEDIESDEEKADTKNSESEEETAEEEPVIEVTDKEADQEEEDSEEEFDEEEYEYVDPDELVLGEHTQAEVDEAIENLNTLGLQGEVYERAKRMLLLELASSEAELDAWLFEQENSKKKKKANVSILDGEDNDDLSDFDEDLFDQEFEEALGDEFDEEISKDDQDSDDESNGEDNTGTESDLDESDNGELGSEEESEEFFAAEDDEVTSGESDGQETDQLGEKQETEEIIPETIEIDEIISEDIIPEHVEEEPVSEISELVMEDPVEAREKEEIKEKKAKSHRNMKGRKSVVHKKDKNPEKKGDKKAEAKEEASAQAEERGYQVSVRKPFILKNSTSYIDKFADFITENQENRKLSTGFKKLDGMLRFGLHKGSYFIDAQPQYLKNSFMQQIADRSAENGVDVLYISTELSRYDLMVDTISRLSYEMNGQDPDKAHSVMAIMTGEDGATIESLKDELNWFRGRISEHLFILDQEAVDEYMDSVEDLSAGAILEELIRSIVREGAHKPVVFIDNIENILSVEDSEDMKPLMDGIKHLAKELSIPIVMSYGYAQAESEEELSIEELEFHESLGNMCDVYLELQYADMITEDSVELTDEDIREMAEDGESLLVDVMIHRNRRPMRATCQIQATPKFNFFEE